MSSVNDNHFQYQWSSVQDPLHEDPEISMPHVTAEPRFNIPHARDEATNRQYVSLQMLPQRIRAILRHEGFVRPPSIPALMAIILWHGPLRSQEIRDVIKKIFPTDYTDEKACERLVENVKHNLTRCKCFVKGPRARGMAGKGGLWRYVPSAEPKVNRTPRPRARRPAASTTAIPSPAPTDTTEILEEGFLEAGSFALSPVADSIDASWTRTPASSTVDDARLGHSGSVPEAFSIPVMMPLFTQGGPEAMMANAEFSRQWMPFPGPHGYDFGTAGHFQNPTPQQVQSMPPVSSNLFAAGSGSPPTDPYAAHSYGSVQFSS